jgi:predicted DNA-binding WGR domain protein
MARSRSPVRSSACQMLLFPDTASLVRVRPARNEWRFYTLEVWPDLFGGATLMRQWGRIGTEGRRKLDLHPDPGAALNALAAIVRHRRKRGYVDRQIRTGSGSSRSV